jgi:isopentenyl phosphate kinase
VLAIHEAMQALNEAVVGALADEGVPALPVHPLSTASRSADGVLSLPLKTTERMLAEGFVPVLHGDVVVHEGEGATILSGDELVVELARGLDAERVGLCSAVPGVLDEAGSVIPRVTDFDAVAGVLGASEATDVTGGMAGKVRELLALEMPASIFAVDDLGPFLAGDQAGTRIE